MSKVSKEVSKETEEKGEMKTQLTNAHGYSTKRMIFGKTIVANVPGSDPPVKYYRIPIYTKNEDGSVGDLVLETEKVFSFGVGENKDPKTKEVNGYSMPLVLWSKDEVKEEEKDWTNVFEKIVTHCKEHLLKNDVKKSFKKPKLEESDLKKLSPLYWKKDDNGDRVKGLGPMLYAKLLQSKKRNVILSNFFGEDGKDIEPTIMIGQMCNTKASIKIEGIYIGATTISLQIKLYEAQVWLVNSKITKLLPRPKPDDNVSVDKTIMDDEDEEEVIAPKKKHEEEDDEEEEKPKIIKGKKREAEESEEDEEKPKGVVKKKVVDEDDDEDEVKPKKKKKSEEEEDEEKLKPKGKVIKKKKSEDDDE